MMSQLNGISYSAMRKQKAEVKEIQQLKSPMILKPGQKGSKRKTKVESPVILQQEERSNSDSLPDSSTSGNEYRALRRKYMVMEEESFALGTELREVKDEIKVLEDEKLALLDELVVLEGLIDRAELQLDQSRPS